MEKVRQTLADYLHLYLGCRMLIGEGSYATNAPHTFNAHLRAIEEGKGLPIRLFLRPLESMTEEEATQYVQGEFGNYSVYNGPSGWENAQEWLSGIISQSKFKQSPDGFRFLLSKGFDLFGLIDAGLAIDKTKSQGEIKTELI